MEAAFLLGITKLKTCFSGVKEENTEDQHSRFAASYLGIFCENSTLKEAVAIGCTLEHPCMVRRGHFHLSPDVSYHPAWIVSFQLPRLYPNSHSNLYLSTWVSASIQAPPLHPLFSNTSLSGLDCPSSADR